MRYLGRQALLCILSLAVFSSVALAAPSDVYRGIRTDVTFSSVFASALESLGVSVKPLGNAKIINGKAQFKIPLASLDLESAKGELVHSGGLRLKAGSTIVDLTNFIIDTTNTSDAYLSGLVKVNGSVVARLRLFDLTLPALSLPLPKQKNLLIPNVVVELNAGAASVLNQVFGVSAFTGGLLIGDAHPVLQRIRR